MTIEATLQERGARYGDFADHAKIAQSLQDVTRNTDGWSRLNASQRQALTVIADKIARILSGDPNYADNWHDIQGYAKLVEDRLSKPEAKHLNLPVIDPQIKADKAEPHAELRNTWAPGQRWQRCGLLSSAWTDIDGEPEWWPICLYRRHPDDLPKPAEQPWYPDESGKWVEVPDDLMEMPKELWRRTEVEIMCADERRRKRVTQRADSAEHWNWRLPKGQERRIVAYKVVD